MRAQLKCTIAILIGVVLLGSGACSTTGGQAAAPTTTAAPKPQKGGAIAFGIEADPNGLDPTRNAFDAVGRQVALSIFDTWVTIDADGGIQPGLAQSIEHSPDYREWTLHIRPGITFTDGTKLDADAAVTSFTAFKDSAVTGTILKNVTSIDRVDDATVRLTTADPWASFPYTLYGQIGMVAAPSQLRDPQGQSRPIGTGPFKLDTLEINKQIKLVRNKDYWRKDADGTQLPYLDSVTYTIVPDGSTRIRDLQSGSLDVIQARSISDTKILDGLAGDPKYTITHDGGASESAFIVLNTAKAPLDDVRIRRAIAHATDVKALASQNGWPEAKLTDGPYAPNSPWYADADFAGHDVAKAKALVEEYTRSTGKDVTIELASPFDATVLQQIADQWAAAGIKTSVKITDARATVLNAVFGQYDAIFFSYFATVDPDENYYFWTGKSAAPIGAFSVNFSRLADPQLNAALDTAHGTVDVDKRKAAYKTVQERFADQVPFVWLYQLDWIIATHANVKQARYVTTPDGKPAIPFIDGVFPLTETYVVDR